MTRTLSIAITTGRGGREFSREQNEFARHWMNLGHDVETVKLDKSSARQMRQSVSYAIRRRNEPLDRLVFFCHGSWKHLRCGFHIWNVQELAQALYPYVEGRPLQVALYACSTGRCRGEWPWHTDGKRWLLSEMPCTAGFAARLCSEMEKRDIDARILAHGSRGHTTRNPYCYFFEPGPSGHLIYRLPIVQRGTAEWREWREQLKTWRRFEVPFEA